MEFTHDIIIVGGGPVGLGLAIDLGQRGISCAVVERFSEPQPIPKGQNLTQRTMENMDAWGCEPELREARILPPGIANGGLVTYGALISEYHYDWLPREKVQPYYGQKVERLPQYSTEAVLRARAGRIEALDLFFAWNFESLAQDETGVTVGISGVGKESTRTLRAPFCVGCDGSRSPVREAAGITQTRSDHDRRMVLLVFKSHELHELLGARYEQRSFYNALKPELEGYWLFLGRVDGGTEWFFHAPVPKGATEENTDFTRFLHEAVGQEFDLEITYLGFWDLRIAVADHYRRGRVFIAGDAAHSHPPYGGYGINTGFEDARNLGWKLAASHHGWAGGELLESYEAERRPVFVSTASDFIERFIEDDREFLKSYSPERDRAEFARQWAERNAGSSEVVAFEPNYEGSPIIGGEGMPGAVGDHRFEARPGHHLSPRRLSGGQTTYEVLGSGFTLFDFGSRPDPADRFRESAAALGIPLAVVVDGFEDEITDYQARLILVRPDGFVAWAGEECDAEAVLRRAAGHRIV